jgi:uncharacterized membrane protein
LELRKIDSEAAPHCLVNNFLVSCRIAFGGRNWITGLRLETDRGGTGDNLMAFCSVCGAQIPNGTVCAACQGRTSVATSSNSGLADNVAGMLAYVTIIPAIIFLVIEPYNKNRFIRFHSFQCLFFAAVLFILHVGISMFAVVPFMVLITLPLHMVVSAGGLVVWIILLLKANQGLMYKLPVIGDIAEKQANAI